MQYLIMAGTMNLDTIVLRSKALKLVKSSSAMLSSLILSSIMDIHEKIYGLKRDGSGSPSQRALTLNFG
jgi:hypothetical protein